MKFAEYKLSAMPLAYRLTTVLEKENPHWLTSFFAVNAIFARIVAWCIVKQNWDKKQFLDSFSKELEDCIDELNAPDIP